MNEIQATAFLQRMGFQPTGTGNVIPPPKPSWRKDGMTVHLDDFANTATVQVCIAGLPDLLAPKEPRTGIPFADVESALRKLMAQGWLVPNFHTDESGVIAMLRQSLAGPVDPHPAKVGDEPCAR